MKRNIILLIFNIIVFWQVPTFAELKHYYSDVILQDLEGMAATVKQVMRQGDEKVASSLGLEMATKLIFARPNADGLIEKLLPIVRNEMEDLGIWGSTLKKVTVEAIDALKSPGQKSSKELATYYYILVNITSELKPFPKKELNGQILKLIAESSFEIPKSVKSELVLRSMKVPESPVKTSKEALAK